MEQTTSRMAGLCLKFAILVLLHEEIMAQNIGVESKGSIRVERSPPWKYASSADSGVPNRDVRISEIYVSEEEYFVEFGRKCTQPRLGRKLVKPLRFYKLLLLADSPVRLAMVADLGNENMFFRDEENFFVFGFTGNKNFISNSNSVGAQAVPSPEAFVFKPQVTYIVLLFYTENNDLSRKIRLFKNPSQGYEYRPLKGDAAMIDELVSGSTVDLMVFCKDGPCVGLTNELKDFLGSIEKKHNTRIAKSSIPVSRMSSLNNCDSFEDRFGHLNFRYGKATPGTQNDCSGVKPYFCEHVISGTVNYAPSVLPPTSSIRSYDCDSIFQCEKSTNFIPKSLEEIAIKSKTKSFTRPRQLELIKKWTTYNSKEEDIVVCKEKFPNGGWVLERPYIRSWLHVAVTDNKCILKCTVCQQFFSLGFRSDYWWKRPIASEAGYETKLSTAENQDTVLEHEKEPTHRLAKLFITDISNTPVESLEDFIKRYELSKFKFCESTVRIVALVYAEILTTSSFNSHRTFIAAMKSLNIDFGAHHFHERALADITAVISDTFHKSLLKSLVIGNKAFSLIVDGSTDNRNNHLFVCLIQTLEDTRPMVYFYALLHLQIGESAKQIFETFQKRLEDDDIVEPGFANFFRNNLQAVVSDSASVMVGKSNSFFTHIKNYVSRNIISIGCMAHKLELSVQRALIQTVNPDFTYFRNFEKKANLFYQFYMSRGSKRFMHLQDTGSEFHETTRRLKKFYEIRWVSSHHGVILALKQDFKILAKDLEKMKEDTDLSKSTREGASELFQIVTDKSFALVLHEFLDFLKIFKRMSLTLQFSPGVLLRKHEIMESGIQELNALSEKPGSELQSFINNCGCSKKCSKGTCSLKQVEACKTPVCNDVILKDNEENAVKLFKCRKDIYKSFILEIGKYFDLNLLRSLDIFDFDKYKIHGMKAWDLDALADFESKIETVCGFFTLDILDCQQFTAEYTNLLKKTFESPIELSSEQVQQPLDMLIYFLDQRTIPISPVLRRVISTVIIIPFGSADCERAFSIVTRIKSKERSNMLPAVVEQLTRIKMNGPKEMEHFDAFYYARIFLRRHYRADARTGGRPGTLTNRDRAGSRLF